LFKARPAGAASAVDQHRRADVATSSQGARGTPAIRASRSGAGLLAPAVYLVARLVVLIILTGILLALLKANPTNSVVSEVHGWGRWLVGPFAGMFSFHRARVALAVNWGIAAVIYLFAAGLIARLVGRPHSSRPVGRSSITNQEGS